MKISWKIPRLYLQIQSIYKNLHGGCKKICFKLNILESAKETALKQWKKYLEITYPPKVGLINKIRAAANKVPDEKMQALQDFITTQHPSSKAGNMSQILKLALAADYF